MRRNSSSKTPNKLVRQHSSTETMSTYSSMSEDDEKDDGGRRGSTTSTIDIGHIVRKQKKCSALLNAFRKYYVATEDPNRIINSPESMDYMHQIFTNVKYLIKESKDQINLLDILSEPDLIRIFVNLFEYCYIGLSVACKKSVLMDDILNMHHYLNSLSQLVWCLTNFSAKFRTTFHSCNGTKALLDFLRDSPLVDNFILYKRADLSQLDRNYSLMKAIIGSLHNLSKTSSFDGLNATKILINFVHKIKSDNQTYLMPIYMTLANVLTDKEIDELPDTMEIVERLVIKITKCANLIADQKLAQASRVSIDLENGRKVSVCAISDSNGIQWDLTELISGLHHIAVNDKIKSYIYTNCNVKEATDKLIFYGNQIEKEYSIILLHQLSFDKSVMQSIQNDSKLIRNIKDQIKLSNGIAKSAQFNKRCKDFLWSLGIRMDKRGETPKSYFSGGESRQGSFEEEEPKAHKKKQIMISYNTQSREVCVKIKNALEQMGFAIWIDIENIHGSSLEAMAGAIENSDCILICMTEKYKLSPNCRAEAEYTFNIRKKFIPLIMQANYKPDGWLGLILGAKIFIDFTKYSFDEAFVKLKKELTQIFNQPSANVGSLQHQQSTDKEINGNSALKEKMNNDQLAITSNGFSSPNTPRRKKELVPRTALTINNPPSNNSHNSSDIVKWNNERVKHWLQDIGVDQTILSDLTNFDGEMLEELNWIRESASEYFYKSISKNFQVELFEVTRFSKQLRKLFS